MRQWDVGGKLASLAALLIEHSEAVEADLARHYPRDADQLDAFYRGDMSVRRLWVLVDGLPHDSCVTRVQHGEAAEWRLMERLLAALINDFRKANASGKVPDDKLIYPPGESPAEVARAKARARLRERAEKAKAGGGG